VPIAGMIERSSWFRRVVVTGGAGFLGSHLCEALLERGSHVVCVDNLSTGSIDNISRLEGLEGFAFVAADVSQGMDDLDGPFDAVLHFASPASPADYLAHPLETLAAGSEGTRHALALAHRHRARFLLASTSEVYGDPVVHPQVESYWGNVNPVGPRSVYDEAKRFAEALTIAWHRRRGTDVAIARIFNTYGPRMRREDGRLVSNLLVQAIEGRPLTIYGDGTQTRSLCFVSDMVEGILALLGSRVLGPINLGNPVECPVIDVARLVLEVTGSSSSVTYQELPVDDPTRRCPDISRARRELSWEPRVPLREGIERAAEWFRTSSSPQSGSALSRGARAS